jgi:transcriptional regulator with XRE-family HTH domain
VIMEKAFAKNLRMLRKERKLSQQKLASQVGVTQQCVSEWEKGKIEPTMSPLWRLADVFDISIDELIGRKELI